MRMHSLPRPSVVSTQCHKRAPFSRLLRINERGFDARPVVDHHSVESVITSAFVCLPPRGFLAPFHTMSSTSSLRIVNPVIHRVAVARLTSSKGRGRSNRRCGHRRIALPRGPVVMHSFVSGVTAPVASVQVFTNKSRPIARLCRRTSYQFALMKFAHRGWCCRVCHCCESCEPIRRRLPVREFKKTSLS